MNEVIAAAAELQSVCYSQGWRFCFIGGLAVLRWGQPRETTDADLTLLTGFGGEEAFIDRLLESFEARIDGARELALRQRTLVLQSRSGVGLDVSLAAHGYEELVVERASDFEYPSQVVLRTCSAEDLIVLKSFAGRGQDWVDVENIIVRQAGGLDWSYIEEHLQLFRELKPDVDVLGTLRDCRIRLEERPGD